VTAAYYNTTFDLGEDSYERALDSLLDDDKFMDAVADEVLYNDYSKQLDGYDENLESLKVMDGQLKKLKESADILSPGTE